MNLRTSKNSIGMGVPIVRSRALKRLGASGRPLRLADFRGRCIDHAEFDGGLDHDIQNTKPLSASWASVLIPWNAPPGRSMVDYWSDIGHRLCNGAETGGGRLFTHSGIASADDAGMPDGVVNIVTGYGPVAGAVRIPIQSGHRFRFDVGHRSDLIPATIPK